MRMMVSVCALALISTGTAALALDAADKCESSKLKTAGKYAFCRSKAESKAVKTNTTPDFSKCDDKFSFKWQLAETNGGGMCSSNGDEASLQAFITQHTDDVAAALAGGPLPDCPTDLAIALACGNTAIDAGEDCDQANLDDETCVSQGFAGGTLACGVGCSFDTSACYAARFVDNADGTISDNETGLTWEKKVELNGTQNLANVHDADNAYLWAGQCSINISKYCQPTALAAALCTANAENGTTGCDECIGGDGTCDAATTTWTVAVDLNTASFAGHNDWRMPTREELVSIVEYADTTNPVTNVAFHGASCGGGCTDITDPACSCMFSSTYSSASARAPDNTGDLWVVDFFDGGVSGAPKVVFFLGYVRAVRGGS